MAELYNNKPLFPGKSEFDQMNKICEILGTPSQNDWSEGYLLASKINYKFPNFKKQKLKNLIPRANDNAILLLEQMLRFDPLKRPSAAQCLQHPFFQCFDILTLYGLKLNNSLCKNSNTNETEMNNTPIRLSSGIQIEVGKKKHSTTNITNPNTSGSTNCIKKVFKYCTF